MEQHNAVAIMSVYVEPSQQVLPTVTLEIALLFLAMKKMEDHGNLQFNPETIGKANIESLGRPE